MNIFLLGSMDLMCSRVRWYFMRPRPRHSPVRRFPSRYSMRVSRSVSNEFTVISWQNMWVICFPVLRGRIHNWIILKIKRKQVTRCYEGYVTPATNPCFSTSLEVDGVEHEAKLRGKAKKLWSQKSLESQHFLALLSARSKPHVWPWGCKEYQPAGG